MKAKRYEVRLTNPEATHIKSHLRLADIYRVIDELDALWSTMDFEEWTLEISPYWEEVDEDNG